MSTLMRAAVCAGPGQLALEELPVPEPGEGEVRLRVEACGICGTDLSLLPAGYLGPGTVPGHEFSARVDALGPGVAGLAPGQRVAVEPLRSCGRCAACRAGRAALCGELRVLGVHVAGGFAEFVCAPAERLFPVPDGLAPELAALAEPVAVVVHGLRRAGLAPGQRLLVLGAGSLGLLSVLVGRALGAGEVWQSARHPHQAELGRAFGADRVLREAEASGPQLRELGAQVAIETVGGSADTLRLAAEALAPGGSVGVVGVFAGELRLDPLPLLMKEITLAWSSCYEHTGSDADFATALELIAKHRETLERLITHRIPLAEIPRAYAAAGDRAGGAVKVTVLPTA